MRPEARALQLAATVAVVLHLGRCVLRVEEAGPTQLEANGVVFTGDMTGSLHRLCIGGFTGWKQCDRGPLVFTGVGLWLTPRSEVSVNRHS